MGFVVIHYNIPSKERVRVGYKRQTSNEFVYLSRYLYANESPYTISGLPEGSYLIELTAVKDACGGLCGDPKTFPAISHPEETTTTTTSTTSTTTTSTTSSTTTSTTTAAPIIIEWDIFDDISGEIGLLELTRSFTITHNEDYYVPTSTTSGLYNYVIKEPISEPVKTAYFNTSINQGDIPDQVFKEPYYSGDYRYYVTRGLAAFNENEDTQLINEL